LLVLLGGAALTLWALHAAWLAPEIYLGGVAPVELFAYPPTAGRLVPAGEWIHQLAFGGLAGGVVAAGWAATCAARAELLALGVRPFPATAGVPALTAALVGALPVEPWSLLIIALGLAASTAGPAAVLGRWAARVSPPSLTLGAVAGGAICVALTLAGWAGLGVTRAPEVAWLVAWPAVVAVPANVVVVALARPARGAPSRGALPPDLARLHGDR
jgi:hypothetical protein